MNRIHPFACTLGLIATFFVSGDLLAAAPLPTIGDSDTNVSSVEFVNDIVPILTRYGCNSGACHGAAIGRGGFSLSLFGSGPGRDFDAIARQLESRRINVSRPESSLLLRKATETVGHEGGERFSDDSQPYDTLVRWIRQGAPLIAKRHLKSVTIEPPAIERDDPAPGNRVRVLATFDDGTQRDVTRLAVLNSDDQDSVEVTPDNMLNIHRRGSHHVIIRFLDRVVPLRIDVPLGPSTPNSSVAANHNLIDPHINDRLKTLRIPPSPQTADREFIRRVTLDLSGGLPTPAETSSFLADPSPSKRDELIDTLIQSDAFASFWAFRWAESFQVDSKRLQPEGAAAYHDWIRRQIAADTPFDQMASEMLTAVGDGFESGPVNFSRVSGGPDALAESMSSVLMGVRLRCANCHDHPLDHWKQDDYHGLAAIFAKLQRGRVVAVAQRGEVTHPVTGMPAVPKLPGGRYLEADEDGREVLAEWLTAADNDTLATSVVNRVWAMLMSRGIIHPVDDIRSTNQPTHPQLLASLVKHFRQHEFRIKPLVRLICRSAAYQRSATNIPGNASDDRFYSHWLKRPLHAEVIGDMLGDVTGVPLLPTAGGADPLRLIAMSDNRTPSIALDLLGRCDRSTECAAATGEPALATTLHLLNGDLLNARIGDTAGTLHRLLNSEITDEAIFDELYRRLYNRPPRANEREYWADTVPTTGRANWFEDAFWTLLTSDEFLTNH